MTAEVAPWSDRHYIGWEKRANEAKRILRGGRIVVGLQYCIPGVTEDRGYDVNVLRIISQAAVVACMIPF